MGYRKESYVGVAIILKQPKISKQPQKTTKEIKKDSKWYTYPLRTKFSPRTGEKLEISKEVVNIPAELYDSCDVNGLMVDLYGSEDYFMKLSNENFEHEHLYRGMRANLVLVNNGNHNNFVMPTGVVKSFLPKITVEDFKRKEAIFLERLFGMFYSVSVEFVNVEYYI